MNCVVRISSVSLLALTLTSATLSQELKASHAPSLGLAGKTTTSSAIVARVNGVPLTQSALDIEIKRIFPAYAMHGGVPKEYEGPIRQKALDNIIQEELAYQEAKRRKLQIPAAEWQTRLKEIRADYKSKAEFEATMKIYFGSKEAFEQKLRHDMLLDRIWLLEVKNRAVVTDAEVRLFYQNNKARFVRPESVAFQTISALYPKNATPSDKQAARKRAESILPQAQAAKNYEEFGLLAEKVSEDDWRVMMGDHKFVHRVRIEPGLQIAFSMKLGETSKIIETPNGYVIIRLNQHEQQKQLKFAEVRSSIRASLEKERLRERAAKFQASLRNAAKIEIL